MAKFRFSDYIKSQEPTEAIRGAGKAFEKSVEAAEMTENEPSKPETAPIFSEKNPPGAESAQIFKEKEAPEPEEAPIKDEESPERVTAVAIDRREEFKRLCERIKREFYLDWENRENSRSTLELQKRAIIGYEKEKEFFKNRIGEILRSMGLEKSPYPFWYSSLEDGIYQENWGLAGLAEWFHPRYAESSSAKIIGDSIYFLHEGRMQLMPQKISRERKEQLIKAFMLLTPEERMDKSYHETYLLDGTRVTIFTEPMAKKDQASIIFRRYLIPTLSFEEQARRGTIPEAAIPFFESMVSVGYNVVFLGAVRTAKTTFLSTWQRYEDPALEGVMVETDPEIPMHTLLPGAPILQLIADGDELRRISKNLLRSDADYFILAEARDGIALDTAVKIAAKGTKRMKLTFHSRNPGQFPLEAATEIIKATGGDLKLTMNMIASGFDFLFHFIQLQDKRQKRLKGIYQLSLEEGDEIMVRPICRYDIADESWRFFSELAPDKVEYGLESNPEGFRRMQAQLSELERRGREAGIK
jgi:pilus assembly protein CpaF